MMIVMLMSLNMVQITSLDAYMIKLKVIKDSHFSAKGSPLRKKISKFQFRIHNFFVRNRPDLIIRANWAFICQNYYVDRKSKLTAQISRTKGRSDPNFRIIARLWRPTYLLQPNVRTGGKPSTWLPPVGLEEQLQTFFKINIIIIFHHFSIFPALLI